MVDRMFYPTQGADSVHVDGFTSPAGSRVVVITVRIFRCRHVIYVPAGDAVGIAAAIKDAAGH